MRHRTAKRRLAFALLAVGVLFVGACLAAGFLHMAYHPTSTSAVTLVRGRLELEWAPNPQTVSRLHLRTWEDHGWQRPYFRFDGGFTPGGQFSHLDIPLWLPAAILVGLGSFLLHRTRLHGHCPACEYDLRGLPAGSPCPECGRKPETQDATGR